jgi:hypothetical protein
MIKKENTMLMRKHKRFIWILCLSLFLIPFQITSAQSMDVEIDENNLIQDFPTRITFQLAFTSDSVIETINLYYRTERRSCTGEARVRADFEPAAEGEVEWVWDLGNSGDLPPGAIIYWHWLLTDADGNTFTTEEQSFSYEDPNYVWETINAGMVTIVWAEGDEDFAWDMHALVEKAIEHLEEDAGISPDGPVRMTVYPSSEAMVAATVHLPEWAGGVAYPDYNLIVAGIAPEEYAWAEDVIAHEVGHLVSHTLTFNCVGARMPTWLDEGISRFAEGPAKPHEVEMVISKLEAGELPTLRSLSRGFAADPEAARLSYAQSAAVVRFMIEEYGQEQLSLLLQAIQDGQKIDPALEEVYGFNTEGLDSLFRMHMGFDPLPGYDPDATPTPRLENTPVPTLALATSFAEAETTEETPPEITATPTPSATSTKPTPPPTEAVTDPTESNGLPFLPGGNLILISGLLCGGLLLLGALVVLVIILIRRKKNPSASDNTP